MLAKSPPVLAARGGLVQDAARGYSKRHVELLTQFAAMLADERADMVLSAAPSQAARAVLERMGLYMCAPALRQSTALLACTLRVARVVLCGATWPATTPAASAMRDWRDTDVRACIHSGRCAAKRTVIP